jgi:hypothetical protein
MHRESFPLFDLRRDVAYHCDGAALTAALDAGKRKRSVDPAAVLALDRNLGAASLAGVVAGRLT